MIPSTSCLLPAEDNISYVTEQPLDLPAFWQLARHPEAGGIVMFSGEIRNNSAGKKVTHLEYESEQHMAILLIREITNTAIKKWNLHFALCVHRIGKVNVGESAVYVLTSHVHRGEAYKANEYIIDRVKHEVPIWKKEFYEDGTFHWGGNCHCH
jgi:molybdopterin synthase catalytic subunit